MELTKQVPHPTVPNFITTIRHISRADQLRANNALNKQRKPFAILDPVTMKPIMNEQTGEPFVVWKAEPTATFTVDHLARFVVGWEGLVLDGKEVPFSTDLLELLLEPKLDAPIESEVEEEKDGVKVKVMKSVSISWATHLEIKARDPKTFDSDPLVNGSAKQ